MRASLVAQLVKNLPAMRETWVQPLVGKIPWRRAWQPTPVFLPGEFPWTEEPGGLQSMGLQRVGHDWATKHSIAQHGLMMNAWASQVVLLVKNPPTNAGDIRDAGLIPGLGRSPGGGHDNALQYSCLENPTDRGVWGAMLHSVTSSTCWSD